MTSDEKKLAEIRAECAAMFDGEHARWMVRDLLAMLDETRKDMRAVIAAAYPAQPEATPTVRELCEHIGALHDAVASAERKLAEVGQYADVVRAGLALADTHLSFCSVPEPMRMQAAGLVGAAASILRQEIERNPDPERRNSWMVKVFFGESDEAWQLSMRREGNDIDYGLRMQQQRDEARHERNAALRRAEDAERKLAALTKLARRAVAWAEQDDPEVWVACDAMGVAIADVAPVAERHDREVRVKELRRVASRWSDDGGLYGDDAAQWLRDEADRIERGEV